MAEEEPELLTAAHEREIRRRREVEQLLEPPRYVQFGLELRIDGQLVAGHARRFAGEVAHRVRRREAPAGEGHVYALARERVDQPGGVADEGDRAAGNRRAGGAEWQVVAAQVLQSRWVKAVAAAELCQLWS